jgi:hypothetical protein
VNSGQHRDRLFIDVDIRKDSDGLGDPGQPLLDDGSSQVFEMEMDVVLVLADAASLANLDGHGAADDVAGC